MKPITIARHVILFLAVISLLKKSRFADIFLFKYTNMSVRLSRLIFTKQKKFVEKWHFLRLVL